MYLEKTMHDTVININNNNNNSEDGNNGNNSSSTSSLGENKDDYRIIVKESLRDRIYYAAKDGFSLTLLIILKDLDPSIVTKLLNQVSFLPFFWIHLFMI